MDEFVNLFLSKRIEKGLSQDEIAGMLNVTRQAVSKWENGKAMPDISLMPRIAEIFDVSLDELLTGNKPKSVENDDINEKKVAVGFDSFCSRAKIVNQIAYCVF